MTNWRDADAYSEWLQGFALGPVGLGDKDFKFVVRESRGHFNPFQELDTRGILAWHRDMLAALDRIESLLTSHADQMGADHWTLLDELDEIKNVRLAQLWREVGDIPGLLENGQPLPVDQANTEPRS